MAKLTAEQRQEIIENGGDLGKAEHNVAALLDHGFEPIIEMYVNDGDENGLTQLQDELVKLLSSFGLDDEMIEIPFP